MIFIAVDCGPLSDPVNGNVVLTTTTFKSVANYQCNTGFGLIGITTRTCQANGEWSNEPPTCECKKLQYAKLLYLCLIFAYSSIVSDCGPLSPPKNGMIITTGTKFWDTAVYNCLPGFQLAGADKRTCLDTAVWSGVPPTCSREWFIFRSLMLSCKILFFPS